MHKLTVAIITFNEEKNIARCLASVKAVADEILVVDSLSSDRTVEICRNMDCRVISREFAGYGAQKQFAVDQASHDWILSLDADEALSEELGKHIRDLMNMDEIPFAGYKILRQLVYLGRVMRHSGLGHEYILRLFNRKKGKFTQVPVHEEIKVEGSIGKISGSFLHYSYSSFENHIDKTNRYTTFAAEGYVKSGKRFHKLWVVFKFPVTFFTIYFIRAGFLDGYPGFLWSFLAAFYGSIKVAKTIELQKL